MKKNFENIIITISNILMSIQIIVLNFFIKTYFNKNQTAFSFVILDKNIKEMFESYETRLTCLLIFSIIICTIGIIKNRKNFKLYIWYVFSLYIYSLFLVNIKIDDLEIKFILAPLIFPIGILIKAFIKKEKINLINIIVCGIMFVYSIAIFAFDISIYGWLIIPAIMQFIYIFYPYSEGSSIEKKYTIVYIVSSVIAIVGAIIILIFNIIFIYKIYDVYSLLEKFSNRIRNELSSIDPKNVNDEYIEVIQNGKLGFIDANGKQRIECQYDELSSYIYILNIDNKEYHVCIAKKDNQYFLITKDGKNEIVIGEDLIPLKNIVDIDDNEKNISTDPVYYSGRMTDKFGQITYLLLLINNGEGFDIEIYNHDNDDNTIEIEHDNNYNEYVKMDNYKIEMIDLIYDDDYDYESNYEIDELLLNLNYYEEKIVVKKKNGETYSNYGYIPCSYKIDLYSDGYIPFIDLKNGIQGWYNENGDRIEMNGKYEILEVRNNIIIIKSFEESLGIGKIYFLNMNGELLLSTDEITVCDDGYLIKSQNDKKIFIDNNLKQITDEYDDIMPYYPELLICSDFDTKETIILNKNGESISDEKYDLFSPYKDDFVNNVNYDLDQLYYEFYNIKELN